MGPKRRPARLRPRDATEPAPPPLRVPFGVDAAPPSAATPTATPSSTRPHRRKYAAVKRPTPAPPSRPPKQPRSAQNSPEPEAANPPPSPSTSSHSSYSSSPLRKKFAANKPRDVIPIVPWVRKALVKLPTPASEIGMPRKPRQSEKDAAPPRKTAPEKSTVRRSTRQSAATSTAPPPSPPSVTSLEVLSNSQEQDANTSTASQPTMPPPRTSTRILRSRTVRASTSTAHTESPSNEETATPPPRVQITSPAQIAQNLTFLSSHQRIRYTQVCSRAVSPFYSIDFQLLDSLNIAEDVHKFFDNVGWSWFLNFDLAPCYEEMLKEFYTTATKTKTKGLTPSRAFLNFRLFNTVHSLSVNQLNTVLGICSEAEIISADYLARPVKFPAFNHQSVWHRLTSSEDVYSSHKSGAYLLTNPALQFCHYLLVKNLSGRTSAQHVVTIPELYILKCMLEGVKLNLGFWIGYSLGDISSHPKRHLSLGHFVGLIARNMNLFDPIPTCMTPCPPSKALDVDYLISTELLFRTQEGSLCFHSADFPPPAHAASAGLEKVQKDLETLKEEQAALKVQVEAGLAAVHQRFSHRIQFLAI